MRIPSEHETSETMGHDTPPIRQDFIDEREELERVIRHPEISRSSSLVRFLTFVCLKYFEGKSRDIREYTIAVEALGRKESTFDSQIDPIVRVTARALRKRLREYYETEGRSSQIQIDLPLGHYIPHFIRRSGPSPVPSSLYIDTEHKFGQSKDDLLPAELSVPILMEKASVPTTQPALAVTPSVKRKLLWRYALISLALPAIFFVGLFLGRRTPETPAPSNALQWEEPVWSDEFNGGAHDMPDLSKWTFDLGNQNSWGNHELETYCFPGRSTPKGCDPIHSNAFQDGDGHLVLRAQKDADGNWTSARISTRGLKEFQYGRIEARMKLPVGTGFWPAFWMLGANFPTMGWPASGTVDIVENVSLTSRSNGLGPTMIRSSLHAPGYFGGNSLRSDFKLPNGARVDDGFHTYGILWSPGMMQFYFDDPANIYLIRDISDIPEGGEWVFDHPFSLVMNLAVGGDWSGDPDNTTPNSADILVDYVRAYKVPTVPAPTIEWRPVDVRAGSVARSTVNLRGKKGGGRAYLACATEPATATCSLDSSTVDFTDTATMDDTVTISAEEFAGKGHVAAPGHYKLILTATSLSGARSRFEAPFEVKKAQ